MKKKRVYKSREILMDWAKACTMRGDNYKACRILKVWDKLSEMVKPY